MGSNPMLLLGVGMLGDSDSASRFACGAVSHVERPTFYEGCADAGDCFYGGGREACSILGFFCVNLSWSTSARWVRIGNRCCVGNLPR